MAQAEQLTIEQDTHGEALLAIESGREELAHLEGELGAVIERMLIVAQGIGEAKRAAGLGVLNLAKEQEAILRIKNMLGASGMPESRATQMAVSLVLTRREVQLVKSAGEPVNNAE